jgi:hypothetical protein
MGGPSGLSLLSELSLSLLQSAVCRGVIVPLWTIGRGERDARAELVGLEGVEGRSNVGLGERCDDSETMPDNTVGADTPFFTPNRLPGSDESARCDRRA